MARPSVMTEEVIQELENRFRSGANNTEAIQGLISEDTFYSHLKNNPEFSERIETAKEFTTEIARAVVAKRVHRGDVETAKWWLERRNKAKFSTRTENTGADGEAQKIIIETRVNGRDGH